MNKNHMKLSMFIFLFSYFILYGGIHFYVYLKLRSTFSLEAKSRLFLALFLIFMIYAPVLVRLSERAGLEVFARIFAYIGFFWMGIIFLVFSVSVILELYRLIIFLATIISRKNLLFLIPNPKVFIMIPFFIAVLISCYGFFEAKNIRLKRMRITTSKLPAGVEKITVVQLTDIHLGLIVGPERLGTILDIVKDVRPDMLVATGDIVDGEVCNLKTLSEMFRSLEPKYGKFAVTGNHEFYAGLEKSLCFMEDAGFTVLRGKGLTVDGLINIAGVDDPAGHIQGTTIDVSEKALLSVLPKDKFTILLKHRPEVEKEAVGLFDLQLSGHTHNGQIFPFHIFTYLFYPIKPGRLNEFDGSLVYLSPGTGTWGPPVRFLSHSEVTVFEIIKK